MRPLLLLALFALAGCVSSVVTTSLRIDGNIDDATVTVDDQILGSVGYVEKKGVALPPGKHRITIEKAGYFPYDELVVVKEGDPPMSLKVQLEAVPD